ncbi:nucleotidyl transferase [Thioalkalivibrio nitratireducens DSM 14787]|uniref:Nucleotidyl transferase n=1 Tax=Thioalkalivibrio nitratireducens (strain DSM 14787 / UNIQEM 213 / ALEN2) TaxID=1255043 RepID=L0DSU3_THIND|nr:nucleotidyltransferase family protein [Thioalkalivibrio nitratireducens]AGA32083.1 nucleotidyl transferase [Thioalkalivibrio nitratireducens DSM 14787]
MILAAGRGERMRPLTDHTPKPLLEAGGATLIEHGIRRLYTAGYREVVINVAHLGDRIVERVGDGSRFGIRIRYSHEPPGALETAGGIREALDWLSPGAFLVLNADIWCDHPLTPPLLGQDTLAHLVLVDNPGHHPNGDFALNDDGRVSLAGVPRHTFSGIGWYRPELFAALPRGRCPLSPVLRSAIAAGAVSGERYRGTWIDVGTPERLHALDAALRTEGTLAAGQKKPGLRRVKAP